MSESTRQVEANELLGAYPNSRHRAFLERAYFSKKTGILL